MFSRNTRKLLKGPTMGAHTIYVCCGVLMLYVKVVVNGMTGFAGHAPI